MLYISFYFYQFRIFLSASPSLYAVLFLLHKEQGDQSAFYFARAFSADHHEEISTDSSMVAPLTASGLKGRIAQMREQQANDGPAPETTPALKM